jgi:aryl-alcohol dehydrogenase-like predicted oxidoreductase
MQKKLSILGTAMWGWTVEKKTCFSLLDAFYEQGHRAIDCATNYTINKEPACFRDAEKIIQDWISGNGVHDLKLIIKVGSLNNCGGSEINLNPSFLRLSLDYYQHVFQQNLETMMIHWDNRDTASDVEKTTACLADLEKENIRIGLSGLRFPQHYQALVKTLQKPAFLEVKHNYFSSQYLHYACLEKEVEFLVYGANAGGISIQKKYMPTSSFESRGLQHEAFEEKLDLLKKKVADTADPEKEFRKFLVQFSVSAPWVTGLIIGPSSVSQLQETLSFLHHE